MFLFLFWSIGDLKWLCFFFFFQDHPDEVAKRSLTLVAKALQNLANLVEFGEKEAYMVFLNTFIIDNKKSLKAYVDSICVSAFFFLLLSSFWKERGETDPYSSSPLPRPWRMRLVPRSSCPPSIGSSTRSTPTSTSFSWSTGKKSGNTRSRTR